LVKGSSSVLKKYGKLLGLKNPLEMKLWVALKRSETRKA